MEQLILKTSLHQFDTCAEFAREFSLGQGDLVLTNAFIYDPYFGSLKSGASVLYQEQYGTGEPTDLMIEAMLADAKKFQYRRIVAIGGGTILDIAKIMAVAGEESLDTLYEKAPNLTKVKELVILPTTCGTGSEVTNLAIVNRTRLGTKLGLVSPAMYADHSVLVPELLEKLPYPVFATSSLDALVHGVESVLSPKATHYTKLFGYRAIEMILKGYQEIAEKGPEARIPLVGDFLVASNYAGISFGTAGCAAVHATSYPLGGVYHVAHGESNYAMFLGVLRCYRSIQEEGELQVLNQFLAEILCCQGQDVYQALEALLEKILPKKPLHAYGMTQEDVGSFAQSVMEKQGRLLANNYVPLTLEDIQGIYQTLL